jgi:hypothetical protein
MNTGRTAIVVMVFFLAACASAPPLVDQEAVNHMINIDRNGNFVPVVADQRIDLSSKENQRDQAMQAALDDKEDKPDLLQASGLAGYWQTMESALRQHTVEHGGQVNLLLYLHGGLNTECHSIQRVLDQYQRILNESNMYPLFVNWRSGPIDSYGRHLWRIRQGKKSNCAFITSPIYLASDLLASLVYAPKSWIVQGKHSWDSTIQREPDRWAAYTESEIYNIHYAEDAEDYDDTSRGLLWIATSPAKIVTTPFTYTLSKPAWDIMMRRTGTMFDKPGEFHNRPVLELPEQPRTGALALFLDRLIQFQTEPGVQLDITLIGHSMGAIICNEIVRLFPALNITTIVHMASADSIHNFLSNTIRFMEDHPKTQFYGLFLSPKNEDRETSAWGMTPSGSLLTWIDNSFTTPATELDRRAGRWSNMRRALHLIPEAVLDRMHFKIFGQGNGPQEHGAFDDFPYWKASFYWQ